MTTKINTYLKEHGLEAYKFSDDRRAIFKIGEGPHGMPVGSYTGHEATQGGLRDVSAEQIFEEYIKPIVENYEKSL